MTEYCIEEFNHNKWPNLLIHDAVCASSSIPIIFPYRIINNMQFIDGGIVNSFPVLNALEKHKPENIIAISVESNFVRNIVQDNIIKQIFYIIYIPLVWQILSTKNKLKWPLLYFELKSKSWSIDLNYNLEAKLNAFLNGIENSKKMLKNYDLTLNSAGISLSDGLK
jgi:predicted acylesterase/phospholipase RssA